MRVLAALALAVLSSVSAQSSQILVGNYLDSSCTQANPADGPLIATPNGQCLVNPLNSAESSQVTCNSDNTWSFQAFLNGACTGPAIFSKSGLSNNYCLDVIGTYISADCTPSNSTTSTGTGALSSLLNTNSSSSTGNHTTLLITVPVYNATQFNSTSINDALYNSTASILYSVEGVLSLSNSTNSTNTTNFYNQLAAYNVTYGIYTDLNVTKANSSSLLIDYIPGFKLNTTTVNVSSIFTLFNNQTEFGIYNSTFATNNSVAIYYLQTLFNESEAYNTSLTTIIAYLPIYNTSAPVTYDIISTSNITALATQLNTTNTTAIYTDLAELIVA